MGKLLLFSISLVLLLLFVKCSEAEIVDDSIHYFFSFAHDPSIKIDSQDALKSVEDSEDVVRITSANNERFLCKLPNSKPEKNVEEDYNGPTPEELFETLLYKNKLCSSLIDVYWSYSVCHGRFVTQYHDERNVLGAISRTEYYLGNYDVDYTSKKTEVAARSPPTRRIENEDYPYFLVSYNRGTACDVTGKPRVTDVIYICVPNVQNKILSITEVSSCHYEVIIMSQVLCNHPAYQLKEKKDHEIVCVNLDAEDEDTAKPQALQRLDDFHETTFKREYTITNNERVEEENIIDVQAFKRFQNDKSAAKGAFKLAGEPRYDNKETLANNPLVVDHTVNSILTGKECIVGGQGWWKYEFCYGKHVTQFHEEQNGQRSDVLLGTFDEVIHKMWVKESPKTRGPIKIGNHVTQVSHIFTKGDICDETAAHRSVEVRLRCQHSSHSALEISLTLIETKTCEYVLTVDSERFCVPLQYADENGIIELENNEAEELDDSLIVEDEVGTSSHQEL